MNQIIVLIVMAVVSFSSCSKERKAEKNDQQKMGEHGTPANWKFTLPQGNPAEGRKVFVEAECHKCHEVKGETYPTITKGKGDVGPELSQMAGMHPLEYFAESIINPNAVIDHDAKEKGYVGEDGKSKMPDYGDVLTVKQISDLAAYLASLKGEAHKGH